MVFGASTFLRSKPSVKKPLKVSMSVKKLAIALKALKHYAKGHDAGVALDALHEIETMKDNP